MGRIFKLCLSLIINLCFMILCSVQENIYLFASHESIFFPRTFESGFMFRSMTNPELTLCMAWDENQNTFLPWRYKVVPAMSEETSPQNSFGTFEKKISKQNIYGSISRLYSVPLFYLSMPRPIPLPWLLCIINFETR